MARLLALSDVGGAVGLPHESPWGNLENDIGTVRNQMDMIFMYNRSVFAKFRKSALRNGAAAGLRR